MATTAVVEPGTCKLREPTQHNNHKGLQVSGLVGMLPDSHDEAGNSMLRRLYCLQHATDFPAMISDADSHTRALLVTRLPEPAWQAYTAQTMPPQATHGYSGVSTKLPYMWYQTLQGVHQSRMLTPAGPF